MLCLVFSGPNVERSFEGYEDEANVTTWLSKKKAEELMRFHGTNGIKITSDRVYIKRDGRWICVYQDPSPLLPQTEDRRASAPSAAGIVKDGS